MGVALSGDPVNTGVTSLLSEATCYGAIQLPGDGNPIVLLNDRQTVGGYPNPGRLFAATAEGWLKRDPVNESDSRHAPLRRRIALRGWNNTIWRRGCDEQS